MRLSTSPEIDEARALATITAALEAGASLLATAGAYGRDDRDPHGNERLIGRALEHRVDRATITVATKGGLIRHGDHYHADGRAIALRADCDASREALGVTALDLFLLHAIDRKTALETSVRALDALRQAGKVRAIGLANVTLAELDRARAIATIDAVEIALSPLDDSAIRGGLVARCAERGIRVLAHSPLGGPKRAPKLAADAALSSIAARRGLAPAEIAIAWLKHISPAIIPLPGARTPEAARAAIRAQSIVLDERELAELDARFVSAARLRSGRDRRPRDDAPGEVVVLMGIQGAGKSTLARELTDAGYLRLNRDELGGTLSSLVPRLRDALRGGASRVVLDNTYASRASRNEVIEAAWDHGIPVRCVWLDTPLALAQANVVERMLASRGRLLEPREIHAIARKDPSIVPPRALFRFRRELEPPSREEGYRTIEIVPFARRPPPDRDRAGVIVALELLASIAPPYRAIAIDRGRIDALRSADAVIGAIGWTPVADDGERLRRDAALAELRALGVDARTCEHPAGPPTCWCRPPLPGLAVALAHAHRLDPARTVVLGASAIHRTLAEAIGARHESSR